MSICNTHAHTHTRSHTYTHAQHMRTHMHTHTCTHTCTHTHAHTHTHTHTHLASFFEADCPTALKKSNGRHLPFWGWRPPPTQTDIMHVEQMWTYADRQYACRTKVDLRRQKLCMLSKRGMCYPHRFHTPNCSASCLLNEPCLDVPALGTIHSSSQSTQQSRLSSTKAILQMAAEGSQV